MDRVLAFDQWLFLFLNHLPHTGLSNLLALTLSGVGTAGIIWFIMTAILFLKEQKKDHRFFLPFVLSGGTSWAVVELVLKPLFGRIRPTELMGAIIVGSGSDGFSFPSGHATIAFAMATVLAHKEPKWRWVFISLAVLISLSRIYLGKHYPLDVIMGGLIGTAIGFLSRIVTQKHVQA
ncbi:MAG: phosphatase PAP2 family protein [Candidatus Gottesmanbacteria bacterium]|nr:phosphatase PAP2 family protein [Candidatus Gottesmanbacteria bacterium]